MRKNNSGFLIAGIFLMLFAFLFVVSNYSEWAEGDSVFFNLPITGFLIEKSLDTSLNTNTTYENNFTHLNISDEGLLLYFPFDVNSSPNNITYDYSLNNNDGVAFNRNYTTSGCVFGGCYDFDNYGNLTFGTPITLTTGTYSFWIKPIDLSSINRIIFSHSSAGWQYTKLYIASTDYLVIETDTNDQSTGSFFGHHFTSNTLVYVTLAREGDNFSLYIDGSYVESKIVADADSLTFDTLSCNDYKFHGIMDEIIMQLIQDFIQQEK